MMKNKIIYMLLICALAFSLAGCKEEAINKKTELNDETTINDETTTNNSEQQSETDIQEETTTEEEVDLSGFMRGTNSTGGKTISADIELIFDEQLQRTIAVGKLADESTVVIPSKIDGIDVTEIGNKAFHYCHKIETVILPETITKIHGSAFANNMSLKSINLPEGLTHIGENAFYHCDSLENIHIPDSVTNIENGAFIYCNKLDNVVIPESVTYIGKGAFTGCGFSDITVPKSVTNFAGAFQYSSNLKNVIISDGVTQIGEYAFLWCENFESIYIPASVTYIAENAFQSTQNFIIKTPAGSYAEEFAKNHMKSNKITLITEESSDAPEVSDTPETPETPDTPAVPEDTGVDVSKLHLTGLYEGDTCCIITEDNKIICWETYGDAAKTYDIVSVELTTEMPISEALFDSVYKVTGKTSDGETFIVCTDGRLLRDYNYNEEYKFVYNTFAANRVPEFSESYKELVPSNVTIPTFSNEPIEGIELDADIKAKICGQYYVPEDNDYECYESAYVISEDGYLYEWDNKQTISPDGQWRKFQIIRMTSQGENRIIIDTRYKTYEYYVYSDGKATLAGNYVHGFYVAECPKVDEMPANVPEYK